MTSLRSLWFHILAVSFIEHLSREKNLFTPWSSILTNFKQLQLNESVPQKLQTNTLIQISQLSTSIAQMATLLRPCYLCLTGVDLHECMTWNILLTYLKNQNKTYSKRSSSRSDISAPTGLNTRGNQRPETWIFTSDRAWLLSSLPLPYLRGSDPRTQPGPEGRVRKDHDVHPAVHVYLNALSTMPHT